MTPARRGLYSAADLERLIHPGSIAIIGASATPESFGYRSIANTGFGYAGRVYPINPKHENILGRKCYPGIEDLPEVPDCVVLSVPRRQVVALVERCAALGVGGAVIYASDFAETGNPAAVSAQERLAAIARESGMRIVGPNCLGIINFVDRVGISFQPGLDTLPMIVGPIGLVVQSGALGFILAQSMERGIGFSYNLAPGNSCDVDTCDFINFLIDDETTKAIACVLEGVSDGGRLIEVARRALAAGKPLVVYKMGHTDLARRAALSHTGTLAGSAAAYRAAFERTGAIVVDSFEAVLETVAFFSRAGKPSGDGVGVMSGSGGAAIMAADKAAEAGVAMPALAPETCAKLREMIPDFGSVANPCDITTASFRDKTMRVRCFKVFAEDPSFAAVIMPLTVAFAPATVELAHAVCELAARLPKPVCVVWLNEWYQGPGSEVYDRSRSISIFRSMQRCLQTLKAWIDYYERREHLLSPPAPRLADETCVQTVRGILATRRADRTLGEQLSKSILGAYGVRVSREMLAQNAEEAVRAARELGHPVGLKADSADIPHKTEAGGVRLDLRNDAEVRAAFSELTEAVHALASRPRLNGILVQEMITGGVEIMVGARRDSQFGPLIVCGLGGIFVELLHDVAVSLAPVDKGQALAMLKSLKGYPLLSGFRGGKAVHLDKLAGIICRVSELAHDLRDEMSEIDVNPVIARGADVVAVDALIVR